MKVLLAADESKNVINSVDEDGWSPLHSAASIGNSGIVELLLSKGKGVRFPSFCIMSFLAPLIVLSCQVWLSVFG